MASFMRFRRMICSFLFFLKDTANASLFLRGSEADSFPKNALRASNLEGGIDVYINLI
jgi:hypothetical protein